MLPEKISQNIENRSGHWSNICDKDRASHFVLGRYEKCNNCQTEPRTSPTISHGKSGKSGGLLAPAVWNSCTSQTERGGQSGQRGLWDALWPHRAPIWDVLDENQQRNNFPKLTTFWLFLHEWHQLPHSALLLCIFHWKATDTVPHSLIFDCN